MTQPLTDSHRAEIVDGSGVYETIADLNFRSIDDPREADELLNRNTKTRWKHSGHLVPGWVVVGVDPKTGESFGKGAQLKPDTPIKVNGKIQKYISISGEPSEPLFLDTGKPDYWQKVLGDRTIPISIAEGAKKSGCLLTLGYAAVSLPGVWNAQIKGKLKAAIVQFCGVGRTIYLAFDSDQVSNPQVRKALDRLGRLLSAEGCVVRVILWDAQHKGIDDLCMQAGADAVHEAIASALTFEEWRETVKNEQDRIIESHGPSHFESSIERGLEWVSHEKDSETGEFKRSRTKVGNHLTAIAYIENTEESGAALLLEFKTQQGQIRRWMMPRSGLAGNTAALMDELMDRGYKYEYEQSRKLKRYLVELGQGIETVYTISDKTGWTSTSFLLENRTYGDRSLRFRDVEPVKDSAYELRGTLDGWKSEVANLCDGNSRLIFALGGAFAAPLAHVLEVESGGFHLYGSTSKGKTTALKVAASVVGIPSKAMKLWRATTNGLEGVATAHNNLPLLLDEINQSDPRDVGTSAYMLANGQGKTRARRNGSAIPAKQWNTLFLSSGEARLTEYLKSAGIAVKGGQEIRMPDIPACPSDGYGLLESIGSFASPAEFIRALEGSVDRNCGTALDAFLTRLVEDRKRDEWVKTQAKRLWAISHKLREIAPNEEIIGRVSLRFALVQVALEIAHEYGLLPFPIEQCSWAIQTLFSDWLNARGGAGSVEIKQACDRLEHLFVTNEFSDRIYRVEETSSNQTIRKLLAYRKHDPFESEPEFWVPSGVFNSEFCQGVDKTQLINELLARGWLKPSTEPGRFQVQRKLGNRKIRVYVFRIFWDNTSETGTTGTTGTEKQNPDTESDSAVPTDPKPVPMPKTETGTTGTIPLKFSMEIPQTIDKILKSIPVVPSTQNGMGTAETLTGQCGTRGTHGTQPKTANQKNQSQNIFEPTGEVIVDADDF